MNFRAFDLNLLRVFDVVMLERRVTRAAQRLSMTQAAVGNELRRLRNAIGEELFVPGPSGMTPPRRAQALCRRCTPAALDRRPSCFRWPQARQHSPTPA